MSITFASLKTIISILLLFILSFSIGLKTIVVLQWQLNKEYIAKNLCENRKKPNSCCEGKCQLKKRLSKVDKDIDNKNEKGVQLEKLHIVDLINNPSLNYTLPTYYLCKPSTQYISYQSNYSFIYLSKVDKPPSLLI